MLPADIIAANKVPCEFFGPFIDTIRCHIALRVATFGNTLSQPSAEIMDLDKDILDEAIGELEDIILLLSKNIFQLDLYLSCNPGMKTPAMLTALKNFKALKQTTEVAPTSWAVFARQTRQLAFLA